LTEDWQEGGFGLYVHWPFCQAKCPYCDFNSHVSRETDQDHWCRAYLSELDRYAAEVPGRVVTSVFFGGGTPSLMNPDVVGAILDRIARLWPMANAPEITLEANPSSVEAGRFRGYSTAGVNRVSMGIQALNNRDLARLGRLHSVEEAYTAFDIARQNFSRVSFDLIYARQGQTVQDWQKELEQALAMAVDHLSLYQLTIEPGTAFGDRFARGTLRGLPDEDETADMYLLTQDLCQAADLSGYEVSNHAAPGAESRHNMIYWRYGDFVGIGPGAHGRLTLDGQRHATVGHHAPGAWLDAVDSGHGEATRDAIAPAQQADEFLMMGLRLSDGIALGRYRALSGHPLPCEKLSYLSGMGMIEVSGDTMRVTEKGRPLLNAITRELLSG